MADILPSQTVPVGYDPPRLREPRVWLVPARKNWLRSSCKTPSHRLNRNRIQG